LAAWDQANLEIAQLVALKERAGKSMSKGKPSFP